MRRRESSWLVLALSIAATPAAFARPEEEPLDLEFGELLELDVVKVTSQRREESLLEVPVAVSVLETRVLRRGQVDSTAETLEQVPNAAFGERAEEGDRTTDLAIRGITDDYAFQDDPFAKSIGFYRDEVNIAVLAIRTANPQLYDVERVEVLRGPQGTYFGRNALGGAINVVTVEPQPELAAEALVDYGKFDTLEAAGMFNVPLSDTVFIRGVGTWTQGDGYVENADPTGPDGDVQNGQARLRAKWDPDGAFRLDVSAEYVHERSGLDRTVPTGVLDLDTQGTLGITMPVDQGLGYYPDNQHRVARNSDESMRSQLWLLNARFWIDTEAFVIRGISGVNLSESDRLFDADTIARDYFELEFDRSASTLSQEVRLESPTDQRLIWIVGALVARDDVEQTLDVTTGADAAEFGGPVVPGISLTSVTQRYQTTEVALLGDARLSLTDALAAGVGLRYTFDRVSAGSSDQSAFGEPLPPAEDDVRFHDVSPRFLVTYRWDENVMSYASATRGYKAGGIQLNQQVGTQEFDPEGIWSFEAGGKSELWGRRLRLNGAVFYYQRNKVQVVREETSLDPDGTVGPVSFTTNDASVDGMGAEVELTAAWPEGLHSHVGVGLQRVEFDEFSDGFLQGYSIDFSGLRVPMAPTATVNVQVEYDFELVCDETSFVRAEWYYRSGMTSDLEGVASHGELLDADDNPVTLPSFPYQMPAYHVLDLRIGQSYAGFLAVAYVENVLDDDYYNSTTDNFGLSGIRVKLHPRTYGLRVRYGF